MNESKSAFAERAQAKFVNKYLNLCMQKTVALLDLKVSHL